MTLSPRIGVVEVQSQQRFGLQITHVPYRNTPQSIADIAAGRVRSVVDYGLKTLNIISCPSCSRVENEAFIDLAQNVRQVGPGERVDISITVENTGRVAGDGNGNKKEEEQR